MKRTKFKPELSINLSGIKMKNPVMVASGTFAYGEEFAEIIDLGKLGAIVTKTITLKPRLGSSPPRIIETPSGMLNAIGLENKGVEDFIEERLPFLLRFDTPVIVSIGGETIEEYINLSRILNKVKGIAGLEMNISCPNIRYKKEKAKGSFRLFAQDAKATQEVVRRARKVTKLPLIVKLSPDVTDITEIAKVAQNAGADVLSLVNTFLGMAIDIVSRRPKLSNITGGLSGPAIKPLALRIVYEVARKVKLPLIGMGGISSFKDALEFFIAGAEAIAIGTANFVNPRTTLEVIEGIEGYLKENKIKSIKQLKQNQK